MKLHGSAGFRYSLPFFDALAENVCAGLVYKGVVYEGPVLQTEREVPHHAASALDAKAYWLHPGGTLHCLSARDLQEGGAAAMSAVPPDTEEEYKEVAAAFGYLYLGGRCDVTDLLQDRGTMQDQRWVALTWQVPETALSACWWMTNPQDMACADAVPHFLCKSIGLLRAELHRLRVATLGKIRDELQRRREKNEEVRSHLGDNAEWCGTAGEPQLACLRRPTSTRISELKASA